MTAEGKPFTRRDFLQSAAVTAGAATLGVAAPIAGQASQSAAILVTVPVCLTVNGSTRELSLEPRVTLLDALREHLGLTGTKKGCDRGQCGACTVLVNGRRINSCLALAVRHDRDEIVTVEGLGTEERLHPMQSAFLTHDAFQCGFCTPGQLCSAVAFLRERGSAGGASMTDVDIREGMSGNLCRCGAYPNIVAAIREAARHG